MKMSDLAQLAGVSKSTVSRALADSDRVKPETRRLIKELAKKHNYHMNTRARNFRLKNVLTLGMLLPSAGRDHWLATNPHLLELIGALSDEIESHGHELLLAKHNNSNPAWLEDFVYNRSVDGIIVLGQSIYHDILNNIAANYKKMVIWGAFLTDQNYVTVGSDNYRGGQLVAQHFLLRRKRKRFLFIGDTRTPENQQRLQGFKDTLIAADPSYAPEVLQCVDDQTDETDAIIEQYLATHRYSVDSIFASNDAVAINIVQQLHKAHLSIPGDISVVGYDNINLSNHLNPELTTVEQDCQRAARLLVEKLLELLEGKQPDSVYIPTELIVRKSS